MTLDQKTEGLSPFVVIFEKFFCERKIRLVESEEDSGSEACVVAAWPNGEGV